MTRRVVVYCRLSVAAEESVSIERQVEAARAYAASQGWTVVGAPFEDYGVSATSKKPEDRPAWRALMASRSQYDAVMVWKVDRLSRRVLDFLHADEALRGRGAGIVSVTEPIDMTTAQGRAFATMLAVFAEMEAEQIRARVKAARDYLVRAGRVVGGTVPYGWKSVPNANGSGFVLAQDAERIGYVREMAARAARGDTLYSICRWLDQATAPLPTASQMARKRGRWSYSTVERLLRNPVLAGMTPYQPGRGRHDTVDPSAVLRGSDGLPIIDEAVAILSSQERRVLLEALDTKTSPQARPRASKGATSPLLSGLALCGHCECTMHRGSIQGRPTLSCPRCHQTISRNQLDGYLVQRLLTERGDQRIWDHLLDPEHTDHRLADLEEAMTDITSQMTRDDADVSELVQQLDALKERRSDARARQPVRRTWTLTPYTVRQVWEAANTDEERRAVLASRIDRFRIVRGRVGRYLDTNRVLIEWITSPPPESIVLPDGVVLVEREIGEPEKEVRLSPSLLQFPDGSLSYSE